MKPGSSKRGCKALNVLKMQTEVCIFSTRSSHTAARYYAGCDLEFVGISRRTCVSAIKELTDAGWLVKVTGNDPKKGTNTIYQVITPDDRRGVTVDHIPAQTLHTPCANLAHPLRENFTPPVQTLHTNISNNNTDNKTTPQPGFAGFAPQEGAGCGAMRAGKPGSPVKGAVRKERKPRQRFVPPAVEEVADYETERATIASAE